WWYPVTNVCEAHGAADDRRARWSGGCCGGRCYAAAREYLIYMPCDYLEGDFEGSVSFKKGRGCATCIRALVLFGRGNDPLVARDLMGCAIHRLAVAVIEIRSEVRH